MIVLMLDHLKFLSKLLRHLSAQHFKLTVCPVKVLRRDMTLLLSDASRMKNYRVSHNNICLCLWFLILTFLLSLNIQVILNKLFQKMVIFFVLINDSAMVTFLGYKITTPKRVYSGKLLCCVRLCMVFSIIT